MQSTPEKAMNISKAKKGKPLSSSHKLALKGIKKKSHTDEWKKNCSVMLKQQWSNGIRKAKSHITEEHKNKISQSLRGIKRNDVSKYRTSHSKEYIIVYDDGKEVTINGLKKFARDNSIPYITLTKAYQHGTSIKKYNINKIEMKISQ